MPELTLLSAAVLIASLMLSLALNWYFIRYGRRDADDDMGRRIHVAKVGKQGGIAVFLTLAAVVGSGSVAAFVVPRFFPAHVRDALEARVQRRFAEESKDGEIPTSKSQIPMNSNSNSNPNDGRGGKKVQSAEPSTLPPVLSSYALIVLAVSGARKVAPQVLVLFGAGTVIFLLGLLDDRRGVRWRWKLLVQLSSAQCAVPYTNLLFFSTVLSMVFRSIPPPSS
jgi:UDP-N-acetylmuramyl pentapeptide phosphotransferase/UDP-N-acetylglucosamine-1-phosphate transferase